MGRLLLETKHLSKRFCRRPELALRYTGLDILREFRRLPDGGDRLRPGEFWAVQDINLELRSGEVLGLVGHNGAGKSTLLNLITGILRPTLGQVLWHTDSVILIDHQAGLSPVQTGRENIHNMLSLHGISESQIHKNIDEIINYSGVHDFIDAPVGTYSTGMRLRLAFSIYTQLQPDVFIIDEALGGGDIRFQQKFENYLREYISRGGAILLVSHDLFIVQSLCHQCILLDHGKIYQTGKTDAILFNYHQLMEVDYQNQQQKMLFSNALHSSIASADAAEAELGNLAAVGELFGAVEIEQLEVIAIATTNSESFDEKVVFPGSKVRIRMVCQSQLENISIMWGFLLGKSSQSSPLAIVVSDQESSSYCLQKGRNEFCCSIEQLPLLPGQYLLTGVVLARDTRSILGLKGYEDTPFPLEVKGSPDAAINAAMTFKCSLHIPAIWG
ncbi:MAG: ABC transporter ATP-binding protein [Leptolyngbyaceae cyanobacterium SL_7_1]|nr:ABC transporter ATP-binding protein [Leptolyngbyaceae cyanobacterium SL_7_1]